MSQHVVENVRPDSSFKIIGFQGPARRIWTRDDTCATNVLDGKVMSIIHATDRIAWS
jgi:hypothetical protein